VGVEKSTYFSGGTINRINGELAMLYAMLGRL